MEALLPRAGEPGAATMSRPDDVDGRCGTPYHAALNSRGVNPVRPIANRR